MDLSSVLESPPLTAKTDSFFSSSTPAHAGHEGC